MNLFKENNIYIKFTGNEILKYMIYFYYGIINYSPFVLVLGSV